MSVSAENPVTNEFASFWELKSYMRTVKRVENANKLCSDLSQMIAERASIENAYADNLKKWSTKWRSLIDTGIEYGTGANPWLGLCTEASDISEIHKGISDVLLNNIHPSVKSWTKEQFHKSHVPGYPLKESKRIETDFELAQKPWAKKLKKLTQRQKEYYLACKTLRSLKVQAENARNDPVGNTEQNEIKLKKIQEKTKKAEQDEAQSLDSYKAALVDLDSDKPRYIEDMRRVFQKSQELESSRLQFFKSTFINFYETLDLTKKSQIPSIYSKLIGSINMSVPSEDLNIWSGSHGIDMRFVMPEFEDYSPELLAITKKKVNSVSDSHPPGVTLTGMAQVASPPRLNANQYTGYNNNNDNEVSTDLGFATNGMSKTITTSEYGHRVRLPLTQASRSQSMKSQAPKLPKVYDPKLNPFDDELSLEEEIDFDLNYENSSGNSTASNERSINSNDEEEELTKDGGVNLVFSAAVDRTLKKLDNTFKTPSTANQLVEPNN